MKKILLIVICVVLGVNVAWSAEFTITPKAQLRDNVGGQVRAVSITQVSSGNMETNWGTSSSGSFKYNETSVVDERVGDTHYCTYEMKYMAKALNNYYFVEWDSYSRRDGYTKVSTDLNYQFQNTASCYTIYGNPVGSSWNHDAPTYYAYFKPIISAGPTPNSVTIRKNSTSCGTTTASITVNQTKDFSVSYSGTDLGLNASISGLSGSATENEACTITITAANGTVNTNTGTGYVIITPLNPDLSIEAYNAAPCTITVVVEEAPKITFKTSANGSYTATPNEGSAFEITTSDRLYEPMNEAQSQVTLLAKPATGYYFYRWLKNGETLGTANTEPYTTPSAEQFVFNEDETEVTAEFRQNFETYYRGPKVGYATESAKNGKISVSVSGDIKEGDASKTSLNVGEDGPLDLTAVIYKELNSHSYRITYNAENTDYATFVKWVDADGNQLSAENEYIYEASNAADEMANVPTPPAVYAVFESFYFKPQVTLIEEEGATGYVTSTQSLDYPTGGWSEGVDNTYIGELVQVATDRAASRDVTVYFHAKNGVSTSFKGWATENNENAINAGGSTADTWSQSFTLTSKLISTPQELNSVYAFFKTEMTFYYRRAQVGVGDESESGKVYVDANASVTPPWSTITENTLYTSTEADTDGNDDGILSMKNSPAFYYTYFAQPSDASKSAFVGWSSSPDVYNEVSSTTPYTAQYSASEDYEHPAMPTNMYAFFRSFYYAIPHAYAEGGGKVFVSATQVQTNTITGWAENFEDNITKYQVPWLIQGYETYDIYFYAQEGAGSKFAGWSTSPEGTRIISQQNPYCRSSQTASIDKNMPHRSTPLYAIFQSSLDIKQQDRMICYLDDQDKGYINDARIIIDLSEASTLEVTLNNTTDFQLTNKSGTSFTTVDNPTFILNATRGLLQLHLSYIGDLNRDAIGKTAEITLVGKEGSKTVVSRTIAITIEEAPIITFLPTDKKGSYTIKLTDGSGIMHTMTQTANDNIQVPVTNETQANIEMSVTDNASDDYIFFGWKKLEKGNETYISYDKTCAYTFKAAATVYPEFIPKNRGTFIIKGDPLKTIYHNLQDALDDAEIYVATTGTNQVVVFDNKFGKNAAEQVSGVLAKGQYNIPANVTLLIPGDTGYNYVLGDPSALHKEEKIDPSVFRKLIVEDGTIINVHGNICLYTPKICSAGADAYMARPSAYGQLEMGENCQINLENGAGLYAFGYLTGANSSKVVAKDGSLVYELFQFTDYRGGSGTGNLYAALREDYKVFPANQYYVQNIEIPLELHYGATEMLSTAVTMGGKVTSVELPFIVKLSTSGSGFFKLGQNTKFRKYYDSSNDRQKIEVIDGSCKIDKVYLDMGTVANIIHVEIKSEEYVLPINHNMDLMLKNTTLQVPNDMAFLAGSTVLVDEKSKVDILGNVYVYDRDQNAIPDKQNEGFLASGHHQLLPITYTPSNPLGGKTVRTVEDLQDATWVVNGSINVSGGLYTTAGKAAITSTEQGKITFNSTLANRNTYQAYYIGFSSDNSIGQAFELMTEGKVNQVVTYPVHSASLKNAAPNSWTSTQQGTYTYNHVLGIWEKNQVTDATWTAEPIIITQPSTSKTITGKWFKTRLTSSDVYTVSTTSTGFTVGEVTNDGALTIPITYTSQNKAGEHVGEICIQNGGTTYSLLVTAIEDYTPAFTTNPRTMTAYVKSNDKIKPFVVANQGNVTELVTNANMDWTTELTGVDAGQFTFAFGTDANKLTDSELTFKPTSAGVKNATLTLTATYTDGNAKAHTTSVAIPLVGNANALEANDLAFNDLSSIYVGQTTATNLFTGNGNGGLVQFTIINEDNVDKDGNKQKVDAKDLGITANKAASTINPKMTGTFTIIATQGGPINSKEGTIISKTITIYPRVKWNWESMYFGGIYTNPITFMDGSSKPYTLVENTDAQNVVQYDQATRTAKISNWQTGEAEATFTFKQEGSDDIVFTSKIHRDPRQLRVDVNHERTFKAVNEDTVGVQFDHLTKSVVFTSPANTTSQWTMYFIGVPDELHFTPSQSRNAWQIEESANGVNWMTTFTWASIVNNKPFTHSLLPTTRHLRITYGGGATESEAVLSNFYITALTSIKADQNKLYMPTVATGASISKDVVFTYATLNSELTLSTSDSEKFLLNTTELPATSEQNLYQVIQVTVTSKATAETTGFLYVKTKDDKVLLEIPIQVYQSPQDLPILMASDPLERYYFVTEKTYRTSWTEDSRTIVMDNAVSNAYPFVTFYFSGTPTPGLISFNHSAGCKGTWVIEERASENVAWTTHYIVPNESNDVSQTLSDASRFVRVTYQSAYAEVVNVTNLAIVPTANIKITPAELVIKKGEPQSAVVRANNIENLTITCTSGNFTWTPTDVSTWIGSGTKEANITINYTGLAAVEYATLSFLSGGIELATIELTGILGTLTNGITGIYTGVDKDQYQLNGEFIGAEHRPVNIADAFVPLSSEEPSKFIPLFDYLFIFGETTTMDMISSGSEKVIITSPNSGAGSNAKTPCYIYEKTSGGYAFKTVIDNVNTSTKIPQDFLQLKNDAAETLKVYITGFCPYASTGYTKVDEGVFFFQGGRGDKVHVYLEDCFLYSRYKTFDGHSFIDRSNGESYSEDYVRGSGGVLVFECTAQGNKETADRFNVTIHTKGYNLLKSHYGCFFESIVGRAFQVSSPVQIHMAGGELFVKNSYTTLNFDDIWPVAESVDVNGTFTTTERTNGFLSLQKQVNNAPSIDLGNANTILNFNGGRIELQNAQVVSTNYKTTMAISHRSGEFGGFRLSYGMGSDDSGGTVNFNDGTTTVQTMKVEPEYQVYYLMDEDDSSTLDKDESQYTSCLRCPANTHVLGGSHCMMRACSEPTSKGGAPTDKDGKALGLYKYPQHPKGNHKGGWTNGTNGLVIPTAGQVPDGYGVASVTPNVGKNGVIDAIPCEDDCDDYLNFWFDPNFESSAVPEKDKKLTFWKACMPYIGAEYVGYTREIGGPTIVERNATDQIELITNFLYCQIDQNISDVISSGDYYAPVKNPTPSGGYESIKPTKVGTEYQNYVETYNVTDPEAIEATGDDFEVSGKMYYITTIPSADIWMTFTAPFAIEKVYVVEAFDEDKLAMYSNDRNEILKYQASHNANFAAFFGVAMALGSDVPFETIYSDYKGWARTQDNGELQRGMKELVHYYRTVDADGNITSTNWDVADYYLYENTNNWTPTEDEEVFDTSWQFVQKQDGVLMQQNHTYSLFFPYCMGCFDEDGNRDFWDYWSGKFIIFESTQASEDQPHKIMGSSSLASTTIFPDPDNEQAVDGRVSYEYEWPFETGDASEDYENSILYLNANTPTDASLKLMGNPTFSQIGTRRPNVYTYYPTPMKETFIANVNYDEAGNPIIKTINDDPEIIKPTESFLLGQMVSTEEPVVISVGRSGNAVYGYLRDDNNGNQNGTSGHMPTVGGGNDLFVTSIAGGINVAVAAPQNVRVLSSTGAVIYSGYVTTAVDIQLPTTGIYIVSGENEVQKILY